MQGGENVAKKKINKKTDVKSRPTASHAMLYIVLGIYVAVSLMCLAFMCVCTITGNYENVGQILVPCVSLVGACSCTVVGFYTNKAAKENEIKLSNDKYRMRLEIAKEIFNEYGTSLDDKSVDLLRKLMSDKDVSETLPTVTETNTTWQQSVPQVEIPIDNYEGAG